MFESVLRGRMSEKRKKSKRRKAWEKHEVFNRAFGQNTSQTFEHISLQNECCLLKWNTLSHVKTGDLHIGLTESRKKYCIRRVRDKMSGLNFHQDNTESDTGLMCTKIQRIIINEATSHSRLCTQDKGQTCPIICSGWSKNRNACAYAMLNICCSKLYDIIQQSCISKCNSIKSNSMQATTKCTLVNRHMDEGLECSWRSFIYRITPFQHLLILPSESWQTGLV